ncbi:MAG: hypothetical protein J5896_03280 [Alphaproteobacteria bacterium]|nr:hypothetical protein [Alphaproteobacteria bacterium]
MSNKNKAALPQAESKTAYYQNSQLYNKQLKSKRQAKKINFAELNKAVQYNMPCLIYTLLPNGEARGDEWFALNPTRCDRHLGSFSVNTKSWKFYDFACDEGGHGAIALYAYIKGLTYYKAAKELQAMLEGKNG